MSIPGSSEGIDFNQDHNEYILERNVCYQDSFSESLSQDLLKSIDSQLTSQPISKKDRLDKSEIDDQKSLKDVSTDSKLKTDLVGSLITDSTTPNMTNSNFTTNSNMTGSNDPTSGYPMSTSADVLSSSIDLDIKFDHFGESTTNLDNLKDFDKTKPKRPLKRTDDRPNEIVAELEKSESRDVDKEFECQHVSEVFILLESHSDPQLRGLVRVCMANYLTAALELSHGDYNRWRNLNGLPKDIRESITVERLVEIILKVSVGFGSNNIVANFNVSLRFV